MDGEGSVLEADLAPRFDDARPGTVTTVPRHDNATCNRPILTQLRVVDFTGDGRPDVASRNISDFRVDFCRQEAGGGFTHSYFEGAAPDARVIGRLDAADVTGDGVTDLLMLERPGAGGGPNAAARVTALIWDPAGFIGRSVKASGTTINGSAAFRAGDLDTNGIADAWITDTTNIGFTLVTQQPGGGFDAPIAYPVLEDVTSLDSDPFLYADANGEGRGDLICPLSQKLVIAYGRAPDPPP